MHYLRIFLQVWPTGFSQTTNMQPPGTRDLRRDPPSLPGERRTPVWIMVPPRRRERKQSCSGQFREEEEDGGAGCSAWWLWPTDRCGKTLRPVTMQLTGFLQLPTPILHSLGSTMRSPHHHHLDHPVRVTTDILEDVYFAIRWSLREDR